MPRLFCLWVAILVLASGCSSETPTRHNDFAPLTSITISAKAGPSIAVNTSTTLTVIGNFSGEFSRDITDQAVWSSGAPTVAGFVTAGSPNRVSGLAPGTAVLTATVGGVSATFDLTVTSATATALTVTPAATTIAAGLTAQLTATGTFSDGTTQDVTFDATWTSSDPAVATVSKGLVQGLAVGTATITASFEGAPPAAAQLTVTEVALQSITVTPGNPSILSVSATQFTAIGHFSDGTTPDITSQVAWTSSQAGIATISAGGLATTLSPGTAIISATLNGVSGASSLNVTGGALTGITLSPTNPQLVAGTVGRITATGSFNNGSSRDITGAVGWGVANTVVATVTTPGGNAALLNALASGSTNVTATFGAETGRTTLTVAAPLPTSLVISPTTLNLAVGTSARFTATATFSNGTSQDVTASTSWTSGVPATAPVDDSPALAKGRVHGAAVTAGSVTITATFGGRTDTAQVTARSRTLATLTVSPATAITLASGNQTSFTATAAYSDGTRQDVTEDATWTIDTANVAILADSVNQPGQVVAVNSGTATLTASFDGKTQSVTIKVP